MKHSTNDESIFPVSLFRKEKRNWIFAFLLFFHFINAQVHDTNNTLTIKPGTTFYVSDSIISTAKPENQKIYIIGNTKIYGWDNVEKIKPVSFPPKDKKNDQHKVLADNTRQKSKVYQNTTPKTEVKFSPLPVRNSTFFSSSENLCIVPPTNQQIKYHFFNNNGYQSIIHTICFKESTKNYHLSSKTQIRSQKSYRCRPPPFV